MDIPPPPMRVTELSQGAAPTSDTPVPDRHHLYRPSLTVETWSERKSARSGIARCKQRVRNKPGNHGAEPCPPPARPGVRCSRAAQVMESREAPEGLEAAAIPSAGRSRLHEGQGLGRDAIVPHLLEGGSGKSSPWATATSHPSAAPRGGDARSWLDPSTCVLPARPIPHAHRVPAEVCSGPARCHRTSTARNTAIVPTNPSASRRMPIPPGAAAPVPRAAQGAAGRGHQSWAAALPAVAGSGGSARLRSAFPRLPSHGAVEAGEVSTHAARSEPQGNQLSLEVSCTWRSLLVTICLLWVFFF